MTPESRCLRSSCTSSFRVAARCSPRLEAPGKRVVTLDGQQYVAGDRSRHLYNVHFCRDCGQEYIPVWDADTAEGRTFQRRNIEERQHEDDGVKFGFLMPDVNQASGTTRP